MLLELQFIATPISMTFVPSLAYFSVFSLRIQLDLEGRNGSF